MVCGGITAVKWWANKNAEEDKARIDSLLEDLSTISARRLVVLSTVDVYPRILGTNESFDCRSETNHAYGTNRLYFEEAAGKLFEDTTVVRIAGIFGQGLKKNVIFDLMHDNCLENINPASSFQYYNVGNLWRDVVRAREAGLRLVNFVTEPVATRSIIDRFFSGKAVGANAATVAHYDIRTLHSAVFQGPEGYLASSETVLNELGEFIGK